ncbi:peptidoglycan DD-metalloendopeptidase family protein [Saccharibacillus kuerlensis]|uniref:Metalloendopeptidase n=1 Tax=Saccharibacillus kuerlensis TaxID=459527 RepID=A0ABQ2KYA0_9BACL|nr:peptidoglycan DD-metalloendopeptidase family protein [Saccharibacillus kuerlensis]GGN95101.1 metalloendopeptidase [Saccharibacillus kuerlensis]
MESLDNKGQGEAASVEKSQMRQKNEHVMDNRQKPKKLRRWAAGIVGGIALAGGLTFGGFKYVETHTYPYYTVYSGDTEIGTIADKKQLDQLIEKKQQEFSEKYPDANMKLYTDGIRAEAAEGYKVTADTEATLQKLDESIKAYATGTELIVDGKTIGIVKDEETAKKLIEKAKKSYIGKGTQTAAAAPKRISTGSKTVTYGSASKLDSIKIDDQIAYEETQTSPTRILTEEEAYKLLTIGEKDPVTYTVAEGDTVSSIAEKFDITQDELYANNSNIEEFTLQIGQVLRITLPEPAINVTTVETVSETVPTASEMVIRRNSDMAYGKRIVVSEGKKGVKRVDYRLTKKNGEIVREEWIGQEVVRASSPVIIVKGTKVIEKPKPVVVQESVVDKEQSEETSVSRTQQSAPEEPSSSDDNQEQVTASGSGFSWPVSGGSISSTFGTRWGKLHAGIDLTGPSNIAASAPGTVTYAGVMSGYGNIVIISHSDGYETRYGHLKSMSVSVGQSVSRGQSIGVMGNTGHSTGTHLHFEIRKGGSPQNPLSYLP